MHNILRRAGLDSPRPRDGGRLRMGARRGPAPHVHGRRRGYAQRDRHGCDQPPRHDRPGPPEAGEVRQARARRQAGRDRPAPHPGGPHPQDAPGRGGPDVGGCRHGRVHRRGPRVPLQGGGAVGVPRGPGSDRGVPASLRRRPRARRAVRHAGRNGRLRGRRQAPPQAPRRMGLGPVLRTIGAFRSCRRGPRRDGRRSARRDPPASPPGRPAPRRRRRPSIRGPP